MWLSGFWLVSSVECKFCSRGLAPTRWPLSWKGGRRGRGWFSGDDVRSSEAALPPFAISWTSNIPSFTLMRVWGQCQAVREILHPLSFKASATSGAVHKSTGLLPYIPACSSYRSVHAKKPQHALKQPAGFDIVALQNLINVCQEYESPPLRLCGRILMFTQTTSLGSSAMSYKRHALLITSSLSRITSSNMLFICKQRKTWTFIFRFAW